MCMYMCTFHKSWYKKGFSFGGMQSNKPEKQALVEVFSHAVTCCVILNNNKNRPKKGRIVSPLLVYKSFQSFSVGRLIEGLKCFSVHVLDR